MALARPRSHRRRFVLEGATMISPNVRHLALRTEDGAPYEYLAGQWVKLELSAELSRDYSLASAPSVARPDRVELIVTQIDGGPGSSALHELPVGAVLDTLGPNGLFVREAKELASPALYVATGTGLAPLRAMLGEELARAEPRPAQTLLFGARTEADLLFRTELEALAPRLSYQPTLSRADAAWRGRRGYVQAHLRELVTPDSQVYICGLGRMITEVRALLREGLGLPRTQVHSERYD